MTQFDGERADDEAVDGDEVGRDDVREPDEIPGDSPEGDATDREAHETEANPGSRAAETGNRTTAAAGIETLDRLRTHSRDHRLALAVAALVGLALAWLHWLGLLVGGALVGLVSRSLGRALLAGIGFGVLVLVVFALTLGGSLGAALAMTPASYLTIGAALALPAFGSLARGIV